jgi:hypothetical protein
VIIAILNNTMRTMDLVRNSFLFDSTATNCQCVFCVNAVGDFFNIVITIVFLLFNIMCSGMSLQEDKSRGYSITSHSLPCMNQTNSQTFFEQ